MENEIKCHLKLKINFLNRETKQKSARYENVYEKFYCIMYLTILL